MFLLNDFADKRMKLLNCWNCYFVWVQKVLNILFSVIYVHQKALKHHSPFLIFEYLLFILITQNKSDSSFKLFYIRKIFTFRSCLFEYLPFIPVIQNQSDSSFKLFYKRKTFTFRSCLFAWTQKERKHLEHNLEKSTFN